MKDKNWGGSLVVLNKMLYKLIWGYIQLMKKNLKIFSSLIHSQSSSLDCCGGKEIPA